MIVGSLLGPKANPVGLSRKRADPSGGGAGRTGEAPASKHVKASPKSRTFIRKLLL
jgi:hypothetical protein